MKTLLLTVLLLAPIAQAQSLTFRGNPQHTGSYQTPGPETLTGVKWKFETGGPVRSTPAVTAERVYFGSNDGTFYALNRQAGGLAWKFQTAHPITSSATVQDGKVYVSSQDGWLYALSEQDGSVVWKVQIDEEPVLAYDSWDLYTSSPVIENGVLYIGSDMGMLYALDAADGKVRWKTELSARKPIRATPTIASNRIMVMGYSGGLYTVEASTGKVLWSQFIFNTGLSTAATDGEHVYFGLKGSVSARAHKLETGENTWIYPDGDSWVPSSPALDQGTLYIGGSGSRNLYALNAQNGTQLWKLHTEGFLFSSPAVTPKTVFTGSYDNKVYAVDRANGTLKWSFATAKPVLSSPVPYAGELYIGSDDGHLYALH